MPREHLNTHLISYLSNEGDDSLCAILVHVWQVDLITEKHQPLPQLHRCQHHTIRCTTVFTVVIKCLQQQLRCGGTGEVQTYNLQQDKELQQNKQADKNVSCKYV